MGDINRELGENMDYLREKALICIPCDTLAILQALSGGMVLILFSMFEHCSTMFTLKPCFPEIREKAWTANLAWQVCA
jgi:hypothetical protein